MLKCTMQKEDLGVPQPIKKTSWIKKAFRNLLFGIFIAFGIYILAVPLVVKFLGAQNIYSSPENIPESKVAIVLGAAVDPEGEPMEMLRDRLDVAAELYLDGYIEEIIVSGDNREENYNEPSAMYNYLINTWGIPANHLTQDFAGRRTYDSCARANEIFGLDEVLLISQGYHLPRAIMLCDELGVNATGYSATLESHYQGITYFKFREFWAIHKAVWDLYVMKPDYVGGEAIDIWSD